MKTCFSFVGSFFMLFSTLAFAVTVDLAELKSASIKLANGEAEVSPEKIGVLLGMLNRATYQARSKKSFVPTGKADGRTIKLVFNNGDERVYGSFNRCSGIYDLSDNIKGNYYIRNNKDIKSCREIFQLT